MGRDIHDELRAMEQRVTYLGLSLHTWNQYRDATLRFYQWAEGRGYPATPDLTSQAIIEEYLAALAGRGLARSTVRWHYAGLRGFFNWWAERMEAANPMDRLPAPTPGESNKDVVTGEQVKAVMADCKARKAYRDAALVALLFDTGMRASEAVRLRPGDINWDESTITVPLTKNGESKRVHMGPQTWLAMDLWQARRKGGETFFTGLRGPLTRSGVLQTVKEAFERVGLTGISPHDLRHSFATAFMNNPDARESDLMELAGWKSPSMVRRYSKSGRQQRAIEAHARMKIL